MKKCKCGKQFKAAKSFHYLCPDCIKGAKRCGTCNKVVTPKDGRLICCGHNESATPSRMAGRSLGEMVHILQTGMTYRELGEFLDEEEDIPNT